jgi:hypothetical protein
MAGCFLIVSSESLQLTPTFPTAWYKADTACLPVKSFRDIQRVSAKGALSSGIPCQEQFSVTKVKASFLAKNARKSKFCPLTCFWHCLYISCSSPDVTRTKNSLVYTHPQNPVFFDGFFHPFYGPPHFLGVRCGCERARCQFNLRGQSAHMRVAVALGAIPTSTPPAPPREHVRSLTSLPTASQLPHPAAAGCPRTYRTAGRP